VSVQHGYNFGGIGGSSDINVRASSIRKGIRVSYASANRAYRNRMMVTGSTGMMKNGWSFSFSGSRRWAEEGYVDGTSFNAYAYFLSAETSQFNEQAYGQLLRIRSTHRSGSARCGHPRGLRPGGHELLQPELGLPGWCEAQRAHDLRPQADD
jgi:hypothetical protein